MRAQNLPHSKSLTACVATLQYITSNSQAQAKGNGAKSSGRIGGRAGFSNYRKNTKVSSNASLEMPRKMYTPQVVQVPSLPSFQSQTYIPSTPISSAITAPPINVFSLFEGVVFFYILILVILHMTMPKK